MASVVGRILEPCCLLQLLQEVLLEGGVAGHVSAFALWAAFIAFLYCEAEAEGGARKSKV